MRFLYLQELNDFRCKYQQVGKKRDYMLWEIILAVILAIGICTVFNEARLKRAARQNKARTMQGKQHSDEKDEIG